MVQLETKRLILRWPIEEDDPFIQRIFSDEETMRDLQFLYKKWTLEGIKERRLRQTAGHVTGETCILHIVHKEDPSLPVIGTTGLIRIDKEKKDGSVSILLEKKFWRKGMGLEVLKAVLDYSFFVLNLESLLFETLEINQNMRGFLENVYGLTVHKIVKDAIIYGMKFDSQYIYMITKNQWKKLKNKLS
eukprot:TRINITY_DN12278_c0_g1_i1.p1 TRINITY_DN12278_c0_g1~~TRINITY_DN12278_c0_g1_i1.p1  ORF type:complete len:189 (+),score=36.01 TRINITY_DN12278_c0_g1_i1:35-601(+)